MTVIRSPRGSAGYHIASRPRAAAARPPAGVWAMAAGVFAVYALISLLRHVALQTTAFDLGIFYDAVRHWAHFSLPHVAVKGVRAGYGADFDLLGDHFHPILALLAPTFWIWPHPATLLVDQAALMASSTVPVWVFARRRLASVRAAYLVALAYALYWGLQAAVTFDFHEIAFAVPLIALAIERIDAQRWVTATVAIAALALVKEDLTILVVFFGLYLLVKGRRWLGLGLVAYGVVGYVLITKVAMPALGGHPYVYWSFDRLGPDLPSALKHMVLHPLSTAQLFVTPATKWHTELVLFAPFGMLTLGSPIALLAIPLLAERFFSSGPQYWTTRDHYSATIAPIIAMGAIDGLARLLARVHRSERRRTLERLLPAGMLLAALGLVAAFPFSEFFGARLWVGNAHIRAGHQAIAAVPSGVVVDASDEIQPHLADRDTALLFDGIPHGASYVVANVYSHEWPFASAADQAAHVEALVQQKWSVVFDSGGYVVLRAPGIGP